MNTGVGPTWDYAGIVQVTIDRPVEDVWSHFFGQKEQVWTEVHYSHIGGEQGEVGEIYMQSIPGGQLLYEAVKVEPQRHLVLKITYRETENSESTLLGYDFHTFSEVAGRTTVVLQQAIALPVGMLSVSARELFALPADVRDGDFRSATDKQDKTLVHMYQNLKMRVEEAV